MPHGWRASFSNIMNEWAERGGTPGDRHVIDLMLAHIPEGVSGSEGAYNRAAYLTRRREIAKASPFHDSHCVPNREQIGFAHVSHAPQCAP